MEHIPRLVTFGEHAILYLAGRGTCLQRYPVCRIQSAFFD